MIDFANQAFAPCIAAFGQAVTYQPVTGASFATTGIFTLSATDDKVTTDGDIIQETSTTLMVNTATFPPGTSPKRFDVCIVNGGSWQVSEAVPGQFGDMLLKLKQIA